MNDLLKRCLQLRRCLRKSLTDKYPKYMSSVRDWVRKRKTRAELDLEVSSYLQEPVRKAHTEFLLTLSKLCCGRMSLRLDRAQPSTAIVSGAVADPSGDSRIGSCDSGADQPDPFLLYKKVYTDRDICGLELIKARFYLAAWDRGLAVIDPKISKLLYSAMLRYIKDVISAAVLHRGRRKLGEDKISGLDVWHTVVRTNCDRPAVPWSSGPVANFRPQRDQDIVSLL